MTLYQTCKQFWRTLLSTSLQGHAHISWSQFLLQDEGGLHWPSRVLEKRTGKELTGIQDNYTHPDYLCMDHTHACAPPELYTLLCCVTSIMLCFNMTFYETLLEPKNHLLPVSKCYMYAIIKSRLQISLRCKKLSRFWIIRSRSSPCCRRSVLAQHPPSPCTRCSSGGGCGRAREAHRRTRPLMYCAGGGGGGGAENNILLIKIWLLRSKLRREIV